MVILITAAPAYFIPSKCEFLGGIFFVQVPKTKGEAGKLKIKPVKAQTTLVEDDCYTQEAKRYQYLFCAHYKVFFMTSRHRVKISSEKCNFIRSFKV